MIRVDTHIEDAGKWAGEDALCEQQGVCAGLHEPYVNSAIIEKG